MFDKNFQDISSGKMELFSSFFSAIKSFVKEIVLGGDTQLKALEMGDYTIIISSIDSIKSDLVLIADKDDQKIINKLIPKVIKILLKHQEVFLEWNGDKHAFGGIDGPLSELILSQKKLMGEHTLVENAEDVLKSMWAHKGELSPQAIAGLNQERDFLISRLQKSTNLLRKLSVAEKVLEISEQLKDDAGFITYQIEVKNLRDQVKDTKIKLEYYLDRIKNTLSSAVDGLGDKKIKQGDYKDAYLNLYSFSSKLKLITAGREHERYRELANILINKDEVEDHELSSAISEILKMQDNVEDYLDVDI